MKRRTPIYPYHKEHANVTEFSGYDMPLWFNGIIDEHLATRNFAGLWDVSHMGRVDISGKDSVSFLNHLLPIDIKLIKENTCVYTLLLNENGGIIDDLIVYRLSDNDFMLVVNAGTREKDLNWFKSHSDQYSVNINDITFNTALLALQGPLAESILKLLVDIDLSSINRFQHSKTQIDGIPILISRTGYTGEDGFEINIYQTSENEPYNAINLWNKILDKGTDKGLLPCGLGSRDTLRLEAGLCLYGQDLNEELNPFESRLKWTIDLNKENFVGKKSLLSNQNNINKIRVAFQSVNEGIPRHNHSITCENKTIGLVTSGSYSPLLSKGIGMGYIDYNYKDISKLTFVNRGVEKEISLIKLPFYDTSLYGHNRIK